MASRRLVLDANILIRAVLGKRVRAIIVAHAAEAEFFVPEVAYADALHYLPQILIKQGRAAEAEGVRDYFAQLQRVVLPVSEEAYVAQRAGALARIEKRDPDDWPILAAALALACPIWTEDNDFFGTGVPTWTTDRVEIYLKRAD